MRNSALRASPFAESESALQCKVREFLDRVIVAPSIWTSIDAGAGKMRKRTAKQRKNRGVKRGWPDILILAPGPVLLAIELKDAKGDQSDEQVVVEKAFKTCRAFYFVCRSVEEVQRAIAFSKIPVAPYSEAAA